MIYKKLNNKWLLRAAGICILNGCLLCSCSAKESGLYMTSEASGSRDFTIDADATDGAAGEEISDTASDTIADVSSDAADTADDSLGQGGLAADDETTADEPVTLYVHICGAVVTPGVYELRGGDRVYQAVDMAGGFTEDAAGDYVNLAMELADGMKITIPTVDELESAVDGDFAPIEYPSGEGAVNAGGTTDDAYSQAYSDTSGLININTADVSALMSITGIGETRAKAIVAYRESHGSFARIEDIKNVSGIGDATYEKVKGEITVDTN